MASLKGNQNIIVSFGVWRIRKWRCSGIFKKISSSLRVLTRLSLDASWSGGPSCWISKGTLPESVHFFELAWKPPPPGVLKLNTNCNCEMDSFLSIGGEICDDKGEWCQGFVAWLGCSGILEGELWGIHGQRVAREMGIQKVLVEVDSNDVVILVSDVASLFTQCGGLVEKISDLISSFESCILSHVLREHNSLADTLSRIVGDFPLGYFIFETPPDEVINCLYYDILGLNYPKIIRV